MTNSKDIFLDKELKTGGFYELAIQVCPSADNEPIKLYTEFIWTLSNVEGPFDFDYNKISADIENIRHNGILKLGNYEIPFMTYNIREDEPIETGFNWFDICFYTTAIEKVFGEEYQTWTENPKVPNEIKTFFNSMVKSLYKIHPFQLATIDFEVSGQYYLDNLKEPLTDTWMPTNFFVGQNNFEIISPTMKKYVTIIENINNE